MRGCELPPAGPPPTGLARSSRRRSTPRRLGRRCRDPQCPGCHCEGTPRRPSPLKSSWRDREIYRPGLVAAVSAHNRRISPHRGRGNRPRRCATLYPLPLAGAAVRASKRPVSPNRAAAAASITHTISPSAGRTNCAGKRNGSMGPRSTAHAIVRLVRAHHRQLDARGRVQHRQRQGDARLAQRKVQVGRDGALALAQRVA